MSLALYRRYRPETFAEVIGQEHVTGPLRQAIRNDRVHHAYLFSGPRGCGKTTSARLLARCLNCEQGPTPEPCGKCRSCLDLGRGGPGSIDVVEIDAASHGGVEDARDLRERAFFSPAGSRFKIYIVDEAHMVTTAGFNALLKVVEEPPPHLKFIFATTEPDKVIGTIRSRTHHYPFRLVPPSAMRDYLASLCEQEGIAVAPGVLSLVVRAGAGSVRDALSVLDQLMAGAGADGVTYPVAIALLGYTDAQLIDDVVDGFAAGDGAAAFAVIERVIEGGHDPRRFAQDLLERLRDLVILATVPDAPDRGLIDVPADQLERLQVQAGQMGAAALTRAADLVNTALTEMRGATAPRLHLELTCARIVLPGAHDDESALFARLDRLERRLAIGEAPVRAEASSAAAEVSRPEPTSVAHSEPATGARPESTTATRQQSVTAAHPVPATAPSSEPAAPRAGRFSGAVAPPVDSSDTDVADGRSQPGHAAHGRSEPGHAAQPPSPAGADLAMVRRMWPDVLEAVKTKRRFTWMTLLDDVSLAGLGDGVLTLAFGNEGKRKNFVGGGSEAILGQALLEVLGVQWRIDAVLDPGAARSGATSVDSPPEGATGSAGWSTADSRPADGVRHPAEPGGSDRGGPASAEPGSPDPPGATSQSGPTSAGEREPAAGRLVTKVGGGSVGPRRRTVPRQSAGAAAVGSAEAGSPPTGSVGGSANASAAVPGSPSVEPDLPAPDDPPADDSGLSSRELLSRELGATVIEEYPHE